MLQAGERGLENGHAGVPDQVGWISYLGQKIIQYDSFEIETDNSFTHIFSQILEPTSLFVLMHEAQPNLSSSLG